MDTTPVSSSVLEERVAMYLQAIEYATAANDIARRQGLERDIQILMDLMERASAGQVIPANAVPPPLQVQSRTGEPVANALGELSSRLADYHKALYYADIEIGENRTQQIQMLQHRLQVIQKLQEKAQAGYPIFPEEIPPPVPIPTDDEFVVDPKSVLTERMALCYQAIELAEEEGKKTRVKTLKESIQKMDYLLKRAETNIPIYKKDLPSPPALGQKFHKQTKQYQSTVELLSKMSGLSVRAAKLAGARGDKEKERQLQNNAKMLSTALQAYEAGQPLDMSACPYSLADIERLADEAGVPGSQRIQDSETVRLRYNQYKLQAVNAKRSGQTDVALQHMRVVKGLQSLLQAMEKGETVDMTQVPPPPSEQTPTTEEKARLLTQSSPQSSHKEPRSQPLVEVDGKSLAEELSAFLFESGPPQEGSSSSPSSQSDANSPAKFTPAPTNAPQNVAPSLTSQSQIGRSPAMPNMSPSSGLNPMYTLTQTSPTGSRNVTQENSHPNSSQLQQNVSVAPGVVPSRALKPGTNMNSGTLLLQEEPFSSLNGFHNGGVILEPVRSSQLVGKDGNRDESTKMISKMEKSSVSPEGHETMPSRSEMACIEILKYERMQLDKEGSDDAKVAAETLGRQLEEAKQQLRDGGYEAWLAYLGQVEDDVSSINSSMKIARQDGQDETLAALVIKKELAERELAVMRKRLPELQT